jgi:dihydrodipicolinate synthase/N-acetylneuraminate lyase
MADNKRSRVDWKGYLPAITTPFKSDLSLDEAGLGALLEWLHAEGMHGLVLAGTTGEWTSMSLEERAKLFALAGAQMSSKLPLLAGCSSFTAQTTIELAGAAKAAGFQGILVTPPPYIRPSADEIYAFYEHIGREAGMPICVYNWPPGTGIDMPPELLERLAGIDAVVAIKQSTGHFPNFAKTFFALKDKVRVFGFSMDELGLTLLRTHDGDGTMGAGGVLGRVHPDFYNNLWAGNIEAARACGLQDRALLDEWYTVDLVGRFGSGPAILKAALDARGLPGGPVRAPLLGVSPAARKNISQTLRKLGMI